MRLERGARWQVLQIRRWRRRSRTGAGGLIVQFWNNQPVFEHSWALEDILCRQLSHISYIPLPYPWHNPQPCLHHEHLCPHLRNTNLRRGLGIEMYAQDPMPHLRCRSAMLT